MLRVRACVRERRRKREHTLFTGQRDREREHTHPLHRSEIKREEEREM
jgi:hypothetical protein